MKTHTEVSCKYEILKSGIGHIFMENMHSSPQLFTIMSKYWNIFSVITLKYNRKVFDRDLFNRYNKSDRRIFVVLFYSRLVMVITKFKDSRIHTFGKFLIKVLLLFHMGMILIGFNLIFYMT